MWVCVAQAEEVYLCFPQNENSEKCNLRRRNVFSPRVEFSYRLLRLVRFLFKLLTPRDKSPLARAFQDISID